MQTVGLSLSIPAAHQNEYIVPAFLARNKLTDLGLLAPANDVTPVSGNVTITVQAMVADPGSAKSAPLRPAGPNEVWGKLRPANSDNPIGGDQISDKDGKLKFQLPRSTLKFGSNFVVLISTPVSPDFITPNVPITGVMPDAPNDIGVTTTVWDRERYILNSLTPAETAYRQLLKQLPQLCNDAASSARPRCLQAYPTALNGALALLDEVEKQFRDALDALSDADFTRQAYIRVRLANAHDVVGQPCPAFSIGIPGLQHQGLPKVLYNGVRCRHLCASAPPGQSPVRSSQTSPCLHWPTVMRIREPPGRC